MEARTSSPRRLQIVAQKEKERKAKEEEKGAAEGKPGRTVFWILKSGCAPSVARAPLLIACRAENRRKQSRRHPGHRRRRRGHYLPRTDVPSESPVSETSSCCVVPQSSARATCEAVEPIPTSAKRESGVCRRIYHTYSARAPKRRNSPRDYSGDYLGVPKYPHTPSQTEVRLARAT